MINIIKKRGNKIDNLSKISKIINLDFLSIYKIYLDIFDN